jgi:hypothetical protein
MVTQELSDFTIERDEIVRLINLKMTAGLVVQDLNHHFNDKQSKYDFIYIGEIIDGIEIKLRKAEIIYHTYFNSTFNSTALVSNSLLATMTIETEFYYDVNVKKEVIEIRTIDMYRELIDISFQDFILLIASIFENLVRLIEILVRKIIVFGERNPHLSTPFKVLVDYWENLVKLKYRKDSDPMYKWLKNHKTFLVKYLGQLNTLRNRYIHGYGTHLHSNYGNYLIRNFDQANFVEPVPSALIPELVVSDFTKEVLLNTQNILKSFLKVVQKRASSPKQLIPF